MYCNYCGAVMGPRQSVCPSCGKPAPIIEDYEAKLRDHLRLLAILWLVVAALWVVPAGVLFALGTAIGTGIHIATPDTPATIFVPILFYSIAVFLLIGAAGSFFAGWGLLKLRPWGRVVALVLGFISLLHPPFGTALGVYTLIVLLPGSAGQMYERIAHQQQAAAAV